MAARCVRAQQPGKPPTIGYLGATAAVAEKSRTDAFVQRLRELGWIEGNTVAIEYRWGESRTERFPEIATDLVRLPVDIILATSTAAALACKQATTVIPIVFPLTGDPLGTVWWPVWLGRAATLPAYRIRRLISQASVSKFYGRSAPGLRRLAILANAEYPGRISEIADIQAAARILGVECRCIRNPPI